MPDRIMIFIPAYNCEKQLPRVLSKIDERVQALVQEVVIIDNRSTDNTVAAGIEAAKKLNIKVTVLRNQENYNLGGSIKRAFLYAIDNGYDFMITLHGDDQADIRDLLPLLSTGEHKKQDIIIGARFHPQSTLEGYSFVRRLGNHVLNVACSIVVRRRVYDMVAGLNCFRINFFKSKFFLPFPNNLTFDAHVLLYAFAHNANIRYVPITWREEDQISNAKVVKQALIILRLFGKYLIKGNTVFLLDQSGRPSNFVYASEAVWQN